MNKVIEPGGVIGILGGGQLGRMLALAARQMGYRSAVFFPESQSPAADAADSHWCADYNDEDAVTSFAQSVDVVTYEFENVPAAAANAASTWAPLRPGPGLLHIAQNRQREKQFCTSLGLQTVPFEAACDAAELHRALLSIGLPAVVKTTESGYDGKGQWLLTAAQQVDAFVAQWDGEPVTVEKWIDLQMELSVIVARSVGGEVAMYGPIANVHRNHILDVSMCPASIEPRTAEQAYDMARTLAEALEVVGVVCVEFFLSAEGELMINEMAPRPHNSGHLTIEGHVTSQFQQQLRAICGLPPGDASRRGEVAMANLLGDLWEDGEPDWSGLLRHRGIHLHLYGKPHAKAGRKMGHVTAVGDGAVSRVLDARRALQKNKTCCDPSINKPSKAVTM